jgi:transposase
VTELAKDLPPGTPVEIWFQDEARVGQKNGLVYQWAERGSRPRQPKDQRYGSAYIFGAVCPARDEGAALVLPRADTEAMQLHLQEISRMVTPGAHGIVVMDKAGWHMTAALEVPANLSLLHLPPYSPELNPQENIWQFLRQTHLSNRVFDGYEAIVDACCTAWNALLGEARRITSIATRTWATIGQ